MNQKEIENSIIEMLSPRINSLGLNIKDIDKNISLIGQGIIDSLGFVELIGKIEEKYNVFFEFDELDINDFTSINNLTNMILDQIG